MKNCVSKYLFLWVLFMSVFICPAQATSADTVQLSLDDVYQFQDDRWSCGVHSAYRILKGGYNQSVDYNQMRGGISFINPFRVIIIPNIIEIDLDFIKVRIGQPTTHLISSLKDYRSSATVQSSASNERIKDLLWEGKPVIVLIQVGSEGPGTAEGCIGVIIGGTCVGTAYSINVDYPILHWVVAIGYDSSYVYFKNTPNNDTYVFSWTELQTRREWNFARYNQDIANQIQYRGAHPGDIIYFDESLPASKIVRTGNRHPIPNQEAVIAVINSIVLDDDDSAPATSSGAAIGAFRNGQWFLDANGNGKWDGCGTEFCFSGFGQAGDMPASGNWDGGSKSYIGVLRSGTGQWFIDRNGNRKWDGCGTDGCYNGFGKAGDLPVAGDWSGNGFAKIGVFRNGEWYLDGNGNGQWDGCSADLCLSFGQVGDLPVAGNWNGGLKAGVGVFRAGTWYLDYNGNGKWDGCQQQDGGQDQCLFNSFGQAGDLPAAGDWNGDGKAKVGVFRAGTWYLDFNGNGAWDGCGVDRCYVGSFGQQGDLPVAGKW